MRATTELQIIESNPLQSFEQSDVSAELDAFTSSGAIRIVDSSSCQRAAERMSLNRELKKRVEAWWNPICDKLHKAWTSATSARKLFTDPLDTDYNAQRAELLAYEDRLRKQAEEQAKQVEEERAPWEEEEEPLPLPVPVILPTPGISTRNKPWQARIKDEDAFYKALAENKTLRQYAPLNEKLANAMARQLGEAISGVIPGLEAFRERTVVAK